MPSSNSSQLTSMSEQALHSGSHGSHGFQTTSRLYLRIGYAAPPSRQLSPAGRRRLNGSKSN